jgi:hypothetical protein
MESFRAIREPGSLCDIENKDLDRIALISLSWQLTTVSGLRGWPLEIMEELQIASGLLHLT